MTFHAAGNIKLDGRHALRQPSPRHLATRRLLLRTLSPLLAIALSLVLWGCVSPVSLQVHNGAQRARVQATSALPTELRLVTYNIWGLPAWINGAHPGRYPAIARALEQYSPHFILLQEVWSANAHNAAPAGDGWSAASSSARGFFFRRNGLVSLSRFPIVDAEFHPFQAGAWPDSLVCKGALKITVELDHSLRLNVWNVHLQAGPAPLIRSQQIAELAVWVRQAENGQVADLIGGDFNCTPDSEQHKALTRLLGVDVQQLGSQSHFITYDGRASDVSKARTLDYVFIRSRQAQLAYAATVAPAMDADRLEDRFSDHLAVQMDLRLEFVPLTAQSPTLDAGLAGGKQPF